MSLSSQQANVSASSSSASSTSSRKWLREASMRRLSLLMKDKTEVIGSAHKLKVTLASMEGLESSGLNDDMIRHLQSWVDGLSSGRQCMLAILDCYQMEQSAKQADTSSMNGGHNKSKAFQPLDLIRTALSLPEQFLCDAGDLYESVFGRPPANVIKEAFQLIVNKAFENSSSALGLQQINLALKQMQLDALCGTPSSSTKPRPAVDSNDADSKENTYNQQSPSSEEFPEGEEEEDTKAQNKGYDTLFRTKIMIELIRIHIHKTIEQQQQVKKGSESEKSISSVKGSMRSSSSSSSNESKEKEKDDTSGVIMKVIHNCLDTPLAEVHKDALKRSPEELESTNNLLKPYLRRLSLLKASLASQLHELRDSRAFLALGLSSANVSDEEIKKAYRSLAIRYHPDKPGGDTVKFQQLQVWYQEVLKKKKSMSAEEEAMAEMTTKFRASRNANKKAAQSANAGKATKAPEFDEDDAEMFAEVDKDIFPEDKKGKDAKKAKVTSLDEEEESEEDDETKAKDDDEPDKESEPLDDEIDSLLKKTKDIQREESVKNKKDEILVEDVEDEDDEAVLGASNQTKTGKNLLPKYHIIAPVFTRDYESHMEHAECIVEHVNALMPLIQQAANDCSSNAQKNLKWTKLMEKVTKNNKFPSALEGLHQQMQLRFGVPSSSNNAAADGAEKVITVDKVIPALEFVCEISQQVASFAMEFASECGSQYASVAATDSEFLRNIEQCMHASLSSLRAVVPINTAADQLKACSRRIDESFRFAVKSKDIHDVLCEMVKTSIRNASAVVCGTVDNVIKTVMAANKIAESLSALCNKAKQQALQQARRQQDMADMQEQEMDYSEEDREAIRKAREANNNGGRPGNKKNGDDDSEEDEDEEEKAEADEEVFDSPIDELRSKIKKLQVQLNMQQIQALQTLNAETVTLQEQIVDELKSLPFFQTLPDLLHDQVDSFRYSTGQCKPGMNHNKRPSHKKRGSSGKKDELQETVFSLVAEFIDGSMTSMRHSALAQNREDTGTLSDESSSNNNVGRHAMVLKLLEENFAWIRITFASQANGKSAGSGHECWQLLLTVLQEHLQLSSVSGENEGKDDTTAANSVKTAKARLALYPDYRSKTLYFASLLDQTLLQDLLLQELPLKLKEILQDLQQQSPLQK